MVRQVKNAFAGCGWCCLEVASAFLLVFSTFCQSRSTWLIFAPMPFIRTHYDSHGLQRLQVPWLLLPGPRPRLTTKATRDDPKAQRRDLPELQQRRGGEGQRAEGDQPAKQLFGKRVRECEEKEAEAEPAASRLRAWGPFAR